MISNKYKFLAISIAFCSQILVLSGMESDSLNIDPDHPMITDNVRVRAYVTIPNCCADIDSVEIHTNLDEYYYEQTQCSDPWYSENGNPNQENFDSLISFFNHLGVELYNVRFVFNPELAEACDACDCKSGTVIYTYISHDDTAVLSETGFHKGSDKLFDIVESYHPEHYPQCDCYCQCADTISIGILESGSHRLYFTMVFIDTIVPAVYNAYDSIDFNVESSATWNLNLKTDDVFILYPNPAFDHIFVSENLIGCSYELIDFSGQIMMEGMLHQNILNIRNLLPGIYIIRFRKENQTITNLRMIICIENNQ
jgi:hypothetical protein